MNKILVFLIFLISSSAFGIDTEATGFKIINGAGATEVDVHSDCQEVTNTSGSDQFVATKTAGEWSNFQANLPTGMSLGACAPPCDGTLVGGFCWYVGGRGSSCTQVCSTRGGYNEATKTYAGSDGTDAHCEEVYDAVWGIRAFGGSSDFGYGAGCLVSVGLYPYRDTSATTAGSNPDMYRICACNN